jgi:serine/threonine protein kinase
MSVGMPSYMAPEQFQGKEANWHADLYVCGLVSFRYCWLAHDRLPVAAPANRCIGLCPMSRHDERRCWITALPTELGSSTSQDASPGHQR